MTELRREAFRYTPLFCEENIWWLAKDLADAGIEVDRMQVLLLTNPFQSILLRHQRAAPPGQTQVWDYHVVLRLARDSENQILDFDTCLAFASPEDGYIEHSFPHQSRLPEVYRTWVRTIPAQQYLRHFYSDRSHMRGLVLEREFPGYPILKPDEKVAAIPLADYRDIQVSLEGCRVLPLSRRYPKVV